MTDAAEEWHSILPQDLLGRAYRASNGELAWARSDAIEVARTLLNKEYQILAIETWLPTRPGPSPLIDDWDENRAVSPVDFIKTFQWEMIDPAHLGLQPYFNIFVE